MTTITVQKHLLLHGFLYCNCKLCKQKHLKHKQKLFRTMHLCKLNYVNDSEIHVFT